SLRPYRAFPLASALQGPHEAVSVHPVADPKPSQFPSTHFRHGTLCAPSSKTHFLRNESPGSVTSPSVRGDQTATHTHPACRQSEGLTMENSVHRHIALLPQRRRLQRESGPRATRNCSTL